MLALQFIEDAIASTYAMEGAADQIYGEDHETEAENTDEDDPVQHLQGVVVFRGDDEYTKHRQRQGTDGNTCL